MSHALDAAFAASFYVHFELMVLLEEVRRAALALFSQVFWTALLVLVPHIHAASRVDLLGLPTSSGSMWCFCFDLTF